MFVSGDSEKKDFASFAEQYYKIDGAVFIDGLLMFNHYALLAKDGNSAYEQAVVEFEKLGVPVFSPVISYGLSEDMCRKENNPLAQDMPSALILPETAGMIETVMLSVRDKQNKAIPIPERAEHCADRITAHLRLRTKPNKEKRIVLMLHNYACRGVESGIGRSSGLDALESAVCIMGRLRDEGYRVEGVPQNGRDLLSMINERKAFADFRWTSVEDIVGAGGCLYQMELEEYHRYFDELPQANQKHMLEVWRDAPGEGMVLDGKLVISGLRFGNVIVTVQPKRGCYGAKCTGEVCKILHDPSCPPPHQYLAAYRWFRDGFRADAIVDIGTFGNAEFLPGKINGLSAECWPSIVMDSMPSFFMYTTPELSVRHF